MSDAPEGAAAPPEQDVHRRFLQLLEEQALDSHALWERARAECEGDPRFQAMPSEGARCGFDARAVRGLCCLVLISLKVYCE